MYISIITITFIIIIIIIIIIKCIRQIASDVNPQGGYAPRDPVGKRESNTEGSTANIRSAQVRAYGDRV